MMSREEQIKILTECKYPDIYKTAEDYLIYLIDEHEYFIFDNYSKEKKKLIFEDDREEKCFNNLVKEIKEIEENLPYYETFWKVSRVV